jgi:hypothetical protein
MKNDIELKWSKRKKCFVISWAEGQKDNAILFFTIINEDVQKDLLKRGLDLRTLKISINKFSADDLIKLGADPSKTIKI